SPPELGMRIIVEALAIFPDDPLSQTVLFVIFKIIPQCYCLVQFFYVIFPHSQSNPRRAKGPPDGTGFQPGTLIVCQYRILCQQSELIRTLEDSFFVLSIDSNKSSVQARVSFQAQTVNPSFHFVIDKKSVWRVVRPILLYGRSEAIACLWDSP